MDISRALEISKQDRHDFDEREDEPIDKQRKTLGVKETKEPYKHIQITKMKNGQKMEEKVKRCLKI